MRVCAVVAAFAEVQQQATAALQVRQEAAGVLRLDIADPGVGGRQVRAAGNFHVAQQALVVAADAGVAEQRDPLRGGHAAEQALAFGLAGERKRVVEGKGVVVRVDIGGRRNKKKKKQKNI